MTTKNRVDLLSNICTDNRVEKSQLQKEMELLTPYENVNIREIELILQSINCMDEKKETLRNEEIIQQ